MLEPNGFKVEVGESPVKVIRDHLDMSQQQFASFLGIAVSTVSRWERGQGTPAFTPGQFKVLLAELRQKGIELEQLPDDLSFKA